MPNATTRLFLEVLRWDTPARGYTRQHCSDYLIEKARVHAGGALVKAFANTNAFDIIVDDTLLRSIDESIAIQLLP